MKLKRILPILLVSMVMAGCSRDSIVNEEQLTSPDGNLSLSFYLTEKGVPSYSLKHGDTDVVLPSKLGFVFRGKFRGGRPDNGRCVKVYGPDLDIRSGFKLSSVSRDSFDQTWDPVWGEESHIRNNYNELAVTLVQENFEAMFVSFAFCFSFLASSFSVTALLSAIIFFFCSTSSTCCRVCFSLVL